MRSMASYRSMLLVGVLSASIFSLNTFVMLPAVVVSNQPQQVLQSASATFPGENGKIAFVSQRDGGVENPEIYVMNADGSEQTRLTNNQFQDGFPSWSPDGTKIAFTRTVTPGNDEIYVMNADGSEQTRLTNNLAYDLDPNWSPDGTKIAFTTTRDGDNPEIYVMNADGSEQTNISNNAASDYDPDWSPDGTKIAFASDRVSFRNIEVYVMNADGTNPTRITFNSDNVGDDSPSWSPDGTRFAFVSNRDVSGEVYVMNADGTNPIRLTFTESAAEASTSWSPDGTKIAFASNRDERIPDSSSSETWNWEIYIMSADGSEQTRLTNLDSREYSPNFGPARATEPQDTTPPVITVPEDITTQATTANGGTVITFNVTAEDNIDGTATLEEDGITITQDDIGGNLAMACDPSSGSEFPIGDTEVQCTATDEAGNEGGPATFTVTVNPPPPPSPDPLTAEISSNATEGVEPATFEFEAIVTGGTEPYSYNWDFGDGSSEVSQQQTVVHTYDEAGVYTVTLTVTDAGEEQQQQEATDTLEITVDERPSPPPPPPPILTTPREAIEQLISYIESLDGGLPEGAKTGIVTTLERVLVLLSDNNTRNDASTCNMIGGFMNQVNAHERRGSLTEDQSDDLKIPAEDISDMLDC